MLLIDFFRKDVTPKKFLQTRPKIGLKNTLNSTQNWVEMHKIAH